MRDFPDLLGPVGVDEDNSLTLGYTSEIVANHAYLLGAVRPAFVKHDSQASHEPDSDDAGHDGQEDSQVDHLLSLVESAVTRRGSTSRYIITYYIHTSNKRCALAFLV